MPASDHSPSWDLASDITAARCLFSLLTAAWATDCLASRSLTISLCGDLTLQNQTYHTIGNVLRTLLKCAFKHGWNPQRATARMQSGLGTSSYAPTHASGKSSVKQPAPWLLQSTLLPPTGAALPERALWGYLEPEVQ